MSFLENQRTRHNFTTWHFREENTTQCEEHEQARVSFTDWCLPKQWIIYIYTREIFQPTWKREDGCVCEMMFLSTWPWGDSVPCALKPREKLQRNATSHSLPVHQFTMSSPVSTLLANGLTSESHLTQTEHELWTLQSRTRYTHAHGVWEDDWSYNVESTRCCNLSFKKICCVFSARRYVTCRALKKPAVTGI